MRRLEVYDPAMCCASGVCGPKVDPALPRFAADLDWAQRQGAAVSRYNLAHAPSAFAANAAVCAAMVADETCLPLVLVDGAIAFRGRYPGRAELAAALGLGVAVAVQAMAARASEGGGVSCCGAKAADGQGGACSS